MEAIHKQIGEKYKELKSDGFLADHKTDFDTMFNDYITKVKTMLDDEVIVWKEALEEVIDKVNENKRKASVNEHLLQLQREVSNIRRQLMITIRHSYTNAQISRRRKRLFSIKRTTLLQG